MCNWQHWLVGSTSNNFNFFAFEKSVSFYKIPSSLKSKCFYLSCCLHSASREDDSVGCKLYGASSPRISPKQNKN